MSGKLILFEGIDGSGKTTLAKMLAASMPNNSIYIDKKTIEASTEFQSSFMSEVKPIIWGRKSTEPIDEIDEETWLYLHMCWYHMVQEFVLKNKLNMYDYVIMDGWYYKFLARHIVNRKMDVLVADYLTKRLLSGSHVFLLNASPAMCYKRKGSAKPSECGIHQGRSNSLSAENAFINYQSKVYEAYLALLENNPACRIVDANQASEEIIDKILKEII